MKTTYYQIGKENQEYWGLLKSLRAEGESIKCEWSGDYLLQTYELNGKKFIVWENMELGIQHKIEEEK